jgi:hypothetical protein
MNIYDSPRLACGKPPLSALQRGETERSDVGVSKHQKV